MNNSIVFTFELAQQFYNSTEEFPVDFDLAWQWLGYARKDSAKKKLVRNFVEGEDYRLRQMAEPVPQGGFVYPEDIRLTVNCLKEMGMMAGTLKGKEIRQYFLKCEAIAKSVAQDISNMHRENEQLRHENSLLKLQQAQQPQQTSVSTSLETMQLLSEMARVVESFIAGATSLNKSIHTSIHQQSESLRLAFENLRRLHDKTVALPALPQNLTDEIGNLLRLTPRLTTIERRQAVVSFLDLIEQLPKDDERRDWSCRQIGAFLGVSFSTVNTIQRERRKAQNSTEISKR